jgi:hypothetical protein
MTPLSGKLLVIIIATVLLALLLVGLIEALAWVAHKKRRDRERDERSPFWRKKNSAP